MGLSHREIDQDLDPILYLNGLITIYHRNMVLDLDLDPSRWEGLTYVYVKYIKYPIQKNEIKEGLTFMVGSTK